MEISARRALPVEPGEAFAFLSRPDNHRRLTTARIGLRELDVTPGGKLRGAVMVLRGPLWLRRPARTRVVSMRRLFAATLERLAAELTAVRPGQAMGPTRSLAAAAELAPA